MSDAADDFKLFQYDPNLGAAILFIILFTTASALHTWQCVVTKTWFFIAFVVGCWFEVIGFITMCLGRIILITDGERHSLVKRRWLTKFFVIGDVLSFLMQAAGGGIMASGSASSMTTGENVIIAGLVIQILFFSCFVVTAGVFHYRMLLVPTSKSKDVASLWRKSLYSLYVGSGLIWVRCIFRLIEYAQGNSGYLISHEVFLYIFDATLMLGVMVLFALVHPSDLNAQICGPGAKRLGKGVFTYAMR